MEYLGVGREYEGNGRSVDILIVRVLGRKQV